MTVTVLTAKKQQKRKMVQVIGQFVTFWNNKSTPKRKYYNGWDMKFEHVKNKAQICKVNIDKRWQEQFWFEQMCDQYM
jgi:hypothetical protein